MKASRSIWTIALLFVGLHFVASLGLSWGMTTEAETGREFVTRGKSNWLDTERAARELPKAGIDHLVIRTDRPYVHALRNMLRGRGFIGKGTR